MASVTKRGDSYVVRYIYLNDQGERCSGWETFKTDEEAKNRKITIEAELRNGTFLVPNQITVRELFEQWLPIQSRKHKWAPATYVGTAAQAQNLILPYIGNLEVQKVRSYHIEKLYSILSQTPCGLYVQGERQELTEKQKKRLLSGTTIHEVHTLLRTVFSYAVDWNIINKSPVPRDGPKTSTEERKIWDEETVAQALKDIDDPMLHLAVHLTFVGALRQGELLGLTPEDLDYEAANGRGTISISKTLQRIPKEALTKVRIDESYRVLEDKRECSSTSLILKPTKTKKSKRVIFMTGPLKKELKSWIARLEREEKNAGESYRNSGMLFRLPNGTAVESTFLRKRFERWQEEHPEYEKIVFHGLRHSSATYQLEVSGGDIKAVQGNTGHAQAGILVDTYAHIQNRARIDLAARIESDFYSAEENNTPVHKPAISSAKMSFSDILELIQQADPAQKKQLTLALLA